jgi:hypothetical protein
MAVDTYALCTLANFKTFAGITGTDDDARLEILIDAASDRIESYCGRKFASRDYSEEYNGDGHERLRLWQGPLTAVGRVCIGRVDAIEIKGTGTAVYDASVATTSTTLTMVLRAATGNTTSTRLFADYVTLTLLTAAATAETGWTATLRHTDGNWASADIIQVGAQHCLSPDSATVEVWEESHEGYDVDWDAGELIHTEGSWATGSRNIHVEYTAGYATIPDDVEQACMELVKDAFDRAKRDTTLMGETVGAYRWQALVQEFPIAQRLGDKLANHRRVYLA